MRVKLMDARNTTRGFTVWGDGITNFAHTGGKVRLCTDSAIHFYETELLAVLTSGAHVGSAYTVARRFVPIGSVITDGAKSGCGGGTTYEEVKLPRVTLKQRAAFAILCVRAVSKSRRFSRWANAWLNGDKRTARSTQGIIDTHYLGHPWGAYIQSAAREAVQAANSRSNNAEPYAAYAANHVAEYFRDEQLPPPDLDAIARKAIKLIQEQNAQHHRTARRPHHSPASRRTKGSKVS